MSACIVGWAHTRFGKLEGEDVESLIVKVATRGLLGASGARGSAGGISRGVYRSGRWAGRSTRKVVPAGLVSNPIEPPIEVTISRQM